MNKNIKKWLAALESGRYRQTTGRLKNTIRGKAAYCCLGVACQVMSREVKGYKWKKTDAGNEFCEEDFTLPGVVQDWLGLESEDPAFVFGKFPKDLKQKVASIKDQTSGMPLSDETISLISLNDGYGFTFKEIARVIKSCMKK